MARGNIINLPALRLSVVTTAEVAIDKDKEAMNGILAWFSAKWALWDVRVLVLASLTFQIILFVLGKRRKYNSSQRINVVVWLAYLLADWVATGAIGKIYSNNTNVHDDMVLIPAIWAPLVLLHLGGPDTITAYALQDNELWLRHLMGMCFQATLAAYVIVMSWRKSSWLSYLSLPAFVAGIIKYGERVWILKSANDENSEIINVPITLDDKDNVDHTHHSQEEKYVSTLVLAQKLLKKFMSYMENYDIPRFRFEINNPSKLKGKQFWHALKIEMGLMYDLFYTKASLTYTRRGFVLRFISFVCTLSVLVGLFCGVIFKEGNWHHNKYEYNYSMIDVAITGVLLAGALALEIYAAILILSSNWTMLWLIQQGKTEWVIQLLRRKFLRFYKKKCSEKVGQFDLLDFCLNESPPAACYSTSVIKRILGLLGVQDMFDRYMHHTTVVVPDNLYDLVPKYFCPPSGGIIKEIEQYIGKKLSEKNLKAIDPDVPSFPEQIIIFHLETEMQYHSGVKIDTNTSTTSQQVGASTDDDKIIKEECRKLSHYMMYLLIMCPSALPMSLSNKELDSLILYLKDTIKAAKNVSQACEILNKKPFSSFSDPRRTLFIAQKCVKYSETNWKTKRILWLGMLGYAAINGRKRYHLQQLKQGGELLTLFWLYVPQSHILEGVESFKIYTNINILVATLTAILAHLSKEGPPEKLGFADLLEFKYLRWLQTHD